MTFNEAIICVVGLAFIAYVIGLYLIYLKHKNQKSF